MNYKQVEHYGIIIEVVEEDSGWSAYFRNAPGMFGNLHNTLPLTGLQSEGQAFQKGRELIESHQPQPVEKIDIYDLLVQLMWNSTWRFILKSEAKVESKGQFLSRETAIEAGRRRGQEMAQELHDRVANRKGS